MIGISDESTDDHYQKQMTKSYISCYNNKTKELESFEVPEAVFIYIRQLECEINYGSGGIQKLYPFRFGKKSSVEEWKKQPLDDRDFLYQNFGGNTPIVPDETMEELLKDGIKK